MELTKDSQALSLAQSPSIKQRMEKPDTFTGTGLYKFVATTYSHAYALPSAVAGLASEFGKVSGVSPHVKIHHEIRDTGIKPVDLNCKRTVLRSLSHMQMQQERIGYSIRATNDRYGQVIER